MLGPGGFVAAGGGLVLAIGGVTFLAAPLPPGPPLPLGGGTGQVVAGWYHAGGQPGRVAYWNGTRWTHRRRLPALAPS